MQAEVLREILATDLEEIKRLDQTVRDTERINAKELVAYQRFVDTAKEKQLYDSVLQARKAYWEQTETVLTFGHANRDAEAMESINAKQAPVYDEYLKTINELIQYVETSTQDTTEAVSRFISQIRIIGDALAGIAILIAIGTGFAVVGVARRLEEDNRLLQVEVTERKEAEETLRENEEKFRQLAENIADVFWVTSPDLQKIHYVSPAYEQIWGRSVQSSYTNPQEWAEAIFPEERERVFATFLKLAQEPSVSTEFHITRPDGTVRWIFSRGFQVRDAAGKVIRITGVASDITERKQLEAQLFQSQKMETVGKLAGGIAHEFNSILTAIIGRSELLLSDLPSGSPHCANAIAIRKAADLAASLTHQLLAYGRKQILRSDSLNLNQILSGMEGMLRHLMGSDVDVRIVPAVGLPAVKADAGQIEQVIMNIAINAREAMRHGGKLTLETSPTTLDEEYVHRFPEVKPGDYVMLAISDTGAGMNEKVKAHLFEPFFTTKGVGEGTGLGLATCHGIIKQSGGHINVYSELGRGTTFKVYLPQVEQRMEVPAVKPASRDLPTGTETILLVEDDPSLREMASLLLRRLGYAVLAAANGPEALNLTHQRDAGNIDLLFTDIVMPQMDGKELSDRIRALRPQTKTLFTSAYTENAAIHQGVLSEGVALLQKPFTPSALAQKLRAVLDGRS